MKIILLDWEIDYYGNIIDRTTFPSTWTLIKKCSDIMSTIKMLKKTRSYQNNLYSIGGV